MSSLKAILEEPPTDGMLDNLCRYVDSCLRAHRFKELDEEIEALDVPSISTQGLVGLLVFTECATGSLLSLPSLRAKVEAHLKEKSPEEWKALEPYLFGEHRVPQAP